MFTGFDFFIRVVWFAPSALDVCCIGARLPHFLATEREVSVSTHRVALSAILFLYEHVLGIDLLWLDGLERPSAPKRLCVVLSRKKFFAYLRYSDALMHNAITWCMARACALRAYRAPNASKSINH
jgi:hypothetical protein